GVCHEADTPLVPASTYGLCKKTCFELFTRFVEQTPELDGAWGRLFFLYGPREDDYRLLASAIAKLLRGEPMEVGFDRLERDYLFILDAARGLVDLLESDCSGAINLAAGQAIGLGELVSAAARRIGADEHLRLGGRPRDDEAHPSPVVVADTRRARDELGWRPTWTLEDALDQTIAWWRNESER
ncbi:MAG: NAD(P)-dependent oxidoreductase, partial [Acidobacteriota bacterium]